MEKIAELFISGIQENNYQKPELIFSFPRLAFRLAPLDARHDNWQWIGRQSPQGRDGLDDMVQVQTGSSVRRVAKLWASRGRAMSGRVESLTRDKQLLVAAMTMQRQIRVTWSNRKACAWVHGRWQLTKLSLQSSAPEESAKCASHYRGRMGRTYH